MEGRHPRGVFTGPFCAPGGDEVLVAVDSEGQVVGHVVIEEPENRDALLAVMWRALQLTDPHPRLRLM